MTNMNRPIKILLIEDNPGDVRLIQEMLADEKGDFFTVECHDRLSGALHRLTENRVDVVLLDLGLPDSQGLDTYARVHAQFPRLPIIVLSGLHDENIAVRAVRKGAQDYLVKGQIDGKLLVRSMRYAIERKKAEEALLRARDELEMRVKARTAELFRANEALEAEIRERKRMEEIIRQQATHDSLTGLPNRILFLDHLTLGLTQARRNRNMLAVLFLDLDRFKFVNDTLGHAAGDQLLINVAGRLKTCVRESDTIARIGGDEFTLLLPDITQAEDAAFIGRKIISALKEPYRLCDQQIHITVSLGISIYPDDGDNPEKLLMNADIAMYHAKQQMMNDCSFFNSVMNNSSLERMKLGNDLRRSLEREELIVHYQPLMDSNTGKMVCAEALVRWKHPELGLLDALQFIPLAAGIGFLMSIDRWVMTTACAQNKEWQKAGYPPFCVTVNLSAHWFHQANLVEVVSQVLRETDLSPEFLGLEITESTAMQDIEQTILTLNHLMDMGVRVLMDDFGSGYSSLNWLKKFPIQKLKIDKSFINELQKNPDDKAIVNAIVTMAHNLKMTVVAEGVETENQLSFLRSSGCDEIQGFLLGKPLPPDDFKKILVTPENNCKS